MRAQQINSIAFIIVYNLNTWAIKAKLLVHGLKDFENYIKESVSYPSIIHEALAKEIDVNKEIGLLGPDCLEMMYKLYVLNVNSSMFGGDNYKAL